MNEVLLGYEVGTGKPVLLPLHHLAIFGMTAKSGKTTALEALISRSQLKAIAFITKRGEGGFTSYNLVTPYYKPRADWQFVEGLVNVALGEKVKYEPGMRYGIMKVCTGHKDLKEIQQAARDLAKASKREFMKSVYEKLVAYLDIVIPELEKWTFTETLEIKEGVNVMNLTGMRLETQHLVIASTIEYAFANLDHVIVIIPEAWESIPQGKMTPVKWVAQQFIRKGAALGNYLFLDSFPDYEVLFIREGLQRSQEGSMVKITNFEDLWDSTRFPIESDGYEEKKNIESANIYTLASTKSRLKWAKVKHIFRHPYKGDLLRINAVKAIVDLSPNHPIMKYPRHLVETKTLKVHDRLCMKDFYDRIISDDNLFIGNEDLAWLYGFFAAEGWVSQRNHVGLANTNIALLEKAQNIIAKMFHHSSKILPPKHGVCALDINSPRLAEHFRAIAYGSSLQHCSRTKIVPTNILNAPKPIKAAFLDGYFAGDGSHRRDIVAGFLSTSRKLTAGVIWLVHSTTNNAFSIHNSGRKPDAFQVSLNKTQTRKDYPDRIKRIRSLPYEGFLYDIEVSTPDHTFNVGIGNVRVKNSQDIGGIDKTPLRQVDNWLMGRMKEAHEVERILKQLMGAKISAVDIQTLPLGHFFAAIGNDVKKVYVLPLGVPEDVGVQVALSKRTPESVRDEFLKSKVMEENDLVFKEKYENLLKEMEGIRSKAFEEGQASISKEVLEDNKVLSDEVEHLRKENAAVKKIKEGFLELFSAPTLRTGSSSDVALQKVVNVVDVPIAEKFVTINTESMRGKILTVAKKGKLDTWRRLDDIVKAVEEECWSATPQEVNNALNDLEKQDLIAKKHTDRNYYCLAQGVKFAKEA
jgi:hypothetical protein